MLSTEKLDCKLIVCHKNESENKIVKKMLVQLFSSSECYEIVRSRET